MLRIAIITFKLPFKNKRYSNNPRNNFDRLDNVTNLTLSEETSTEMSGYYFSNITSLTLISFYHQTVQTKSIKSLQKIVNLKHLDITGTDDGRSTAGSLLKILKRTPQLSSLAIGDIEIASLFEDEELCNYLDRMIKRLFIYRGPRASWNICTYSMKSFYQTFGNVEHLRYETGYGDALVFWLNHLPKLSTLRIKWRSKHKPRKYLFQLKNEIRKLNLIADIIVKRTERWYGTPDYNGDWDETVKGIDLRMWLGQNTSELLTNFTIVMNTLRKY